LTVTLWRGERLLGALIVRPPSGYERRPARPKPPSLFAFLVPVPEVGPLEGVWQIALPEAAGLGVQQQAVEPDIVAEREQRAATRVPSNSGPVALQPMSPEAVAGVPREVQLTVRTEDGMVYLPRQIHLQEVRYEPLLYDTALREVPREALTSGRVWCAFITFASDADAPAT
jgi:hypothetical protein